MPDDIARESWTRPLAREIPARLGWEDLLFPPEVRRKLEGLVARWRQGPAVLDDWGLGRRLKSRGLVALFAGEPGTGKTEAAAVVARVLGLRLFQVNAPALLSKYVGETEKNLDSVLASAGEASEAAALVFDEGESLFGRRLEAKGSGEVAHNSQVGLLLSRIERFDGLAIVTTNNPARIDPAFQRRFQVVIEFEMPGPEERQAILRLCLAAAPLAADVDLALVTQEAMSGGTIQNVALAAAHGARARGRGAIDQAALCEALMEELEKLGRVINTHHYGPKR